MHPWLAVLTVAFLPVHDLVCLVFWAFFFSLGLVELSCLLLTSFFFSFSLKLYCVCCSPWELPAWFFCLPSLVFLLCVCFMVQWHASKPCCARSNAKSDANNGWLVVACFVHTLLVTLAPSAFCLVSLFPLLMTSIFWGQRLHSHPTKQQV